MNSSIIHIPQCIRLYKWIRLIHYHLSFLRWLARGMCTSLSATLRPSSQWFSLTIEGQTWGLTETACPVWTMTPYPSRTMMTQLPTCWRSESTVSVACHSQMSTTFNGTHKSICKSKKSIRKPFQHLKRRNLGILLTLLDGKQAAVFLHGILSYAIEEPERY